MNTMDLFGKERQVVVREQMQREDTGPTYLAAKMLTEFPLDATFSALDALVLQHTTGLRVGTATLVGTLSLVTVACSVLGFAVGSATSDEKTALTVGMPLMMIYMVVGFIIRGMSDKKTAPTVLGLVYLLLSRVLYR